MAARANRTIRRPGTPFRVVTSGTGRVPRPDRCVLRVRGALAPSGAPRTRNALVGGGTSGAKALGWRSPRCDGETERVPEHSSVSSSSRPGRHDAVHGTGTGAALPTSSRGASNASALTENSPVALARNGPARDRRSADRAMRKPGVGPSVARGAEDLIGRGGWQRSPPRAWVAPRSGREFLAQSGETQAVTSRELMTATSGAHLANKSR
jgi:hypothetical protein